MAIGKPVQAQTAKTAAKSTTPAAAPPAAKPTGRPLLPPVILGSDDSKAIKLQIITGSYEKVLHGFIASIPITSLAVPTPTTALTAPDSSEATLQQDLLLNTGFTDSFLFTAHTSQVRCLALSPASTSAKNSSSSKRILATGAPDERINLYTLASSVSELPPPTADADPKTKSSSSNKHLGTLHEHTDTPTSLIFTPNRHKLITAGEDSQILIFRTRDWSLLSTLKVPKPKAMGASIGLLGNGERPGGVNDIALHPSQKILLSVSRGERSVRMWNLMTGRKAAVLQFKKEVMGPLVGSRTGGLSGEGQKVRWAPDGEEFAVAFERGIIIFGLDSKPKLRIKPDPQSKIHQMQYVSLASNFYALAISTDDGRVLFYSTTPPAKEIPTDGENADNTESNIDNPTVIGQLGGREMGMIGRVKDFATLEADVVMEENAAPKKALFIITSGSDGTIRIWNIHLDQIPFLQKLQEEADDNDDIPRKKAKTTEEDSAVTTEDATASTETKVTIPQIGNLVGIYETGRRITCLSGMVMEEGWKGDEEVEEEVSSADSSDDDSE